MSPDMVMLIRRWFSLSVAEAARVLRVQRPTIHAWERGDLPEKKDAQRIREVFQFASHWRSLSPEPLGAFRKEPVTSDGDTLVDLLSERELQSEVLTSALSTLFSHKQKDLAGRPPTAAELARRDGFNPLVPGAAERNIAREARGLARRSDHEE